MMYLDQKNVISDHSLSQLYLHWLEASVINLCCLLWVTSFFFWRALVALKLLTNPLHSFQASHLFPFFDKRQHMHSSKMQQLKQMITIRSKRPVFSLCQSWNAFCVCASARVSLLSWSLADSDSGIIAALASELGFKLKLSLKPLPTFLSLTTATSPGFALPPSLKVAANPPVCASPRFLLIASSMALGCC